VQDSIAGGLTELSRGGSRVFVHGFRFYGKRHAPRIKSGAGLRIKFGEGPRIRPGRPPPDVALTARLFSQDPVNCSNARKAIVGTAVDTLRSREVPRGLPFPTRMLGEPNA
jgi:hypothetical protein